MLLSELPNYLSGSHRPFERVLEKPRAATHLRDLDEKPALRCVPATESSASSLLALDPIIWICSSSSTTTTTTPLALVSCHVDLLPCMYS